MERKPGFIYIYSEILKQEIALSEKTGVVWCKDGVKYSPQEIAVLAEGGGVLPHEVHIVKKVFNDSEVVRYANGNRTENQGKFASSKDIRLK